MSAYDLVAWAPAILTSGGDNTYNVPGATKLDGTLDNEAPTAARAGDASGFSATPQIAELNLSSYFNQVAGAYNRRALTYNTSFGTTLGTASYIVSGQRIKAADCTGLLSLINTLRAQEGWSGGNLVWPNSTPTSGKRVSGDHLAFLRKSLAISGTMRPPATINFYELIDSPYGTHSSESLLSTAFGYKVGKQWPLDATEHRWRSNLSFKIPQWVSAITTAALKITWTNYVGGEAFNLVIYASNSDDHSPSLTPAYGGTFYTSNNHNEGTMNPALTTQQTIALTNSYIVGAAGLYKSYLIVSDTEFSGSGTGSVSANVSSIATPILELTF